MRTHTASTGAAMGRSHVISNRTCLFMLCLDTRASSEPGAEGDTGVVGGVRVGEGGASESARDMSGIAAALSFGLWFERERREATPAAQV